jgi:hypothetical protein
LTIRIPKGFKKRLAKKPPALAGAILECIHKIDEDPHSPGLHCHRMAGTADIWQARVDQANRLTFRYADGAIELLNHCNHDILRNPG